MKKTLFTLLAGVVLGVALMPSISAGAAEVFYKAFPSSHAFYLNGQQVSMEAYNINGNNYVKLRDIGQAVGFNVYWQDGVQVDTTAPYTGEAPASGSAAAGISISSYKGTNLLTGDRSALVINPSGSYAVTSSDSSIVAVELVSGNWVIEAKSAGNATITAISNNGRRASLAVTVTSPAAETDPTANMETRQEMIRLINQVRQEHGVDPLPVNEALMAGAQSCSEQRLTDHGPQQWETVANCGWPHGANANLTYFSLDSKTDIASKAVQNWVNSPGHLQTMLSERADCLGVGAAVYGRMAYCFMLVGDSDSIGPLA